MFCRWHTHTHAHTPFKLLQLFALEPCRQDTSDFCCLRFQEAATTLTILFNSCRLFVSFSSLYIFHKSKEGKSSWFQQRKRQKKTKSTQIFHKKSSSNVNETSAAPGCQIGDTTQSPVHWHHQSPQILSSAALICHSTTLPSQSLSHVTFCGTVEVSSPIVKKFPVQ